MNFESKTMAQIKGQVSELYGYENIAKQQFWWDITRCLNETISVFKLQSWDIYRFILTNQWQQLWDCKVIVDHSKKVYYVSSIAIVPNLQKKWIWGGFYDQYLIPEFSHLHPWYVFVAWPEQTALGKKLRNGR
jgi:hypothetical protein